MNGRKAKTIRAVARGLTVLHGEEAKMVDKVNADGTKTVRVKSSPDGSQVVTSTKCHPEGSYRSVVKQLKR